MVAAQVAALTPKEREILKQRFPPTTRGPLPFPAAIEAAAQASEGSGWLAAASSALLGVAGRVERFTADEVWTELERRGCTLEPEDARAMGGVLRRAVRDGWIVRLPGEYRASTRKERHGGPVQVWESKVCAVYGRGAK
jgi:hypothetical protein